MFSKIGMNFYLISAKKIFSPTKEKKYLFFGGGGELNKLQK